MYGGKSVGVVIPAYNEEGFIGRTIETVPTFVDRIYPVDDASEDDTWTEIEQSASQLNVYPQDRNDVRRVVPIRHEYNRGVGGAIKTGYHEAVGDGMDIIAVMAGDGQMDPAVLPRMLDPIASSEAAYAKGNRLHRRYDREHMSRWRLFGNSLLTMLTRISSGYWQMTDPQNGYTAISRSALEAVPFEQLYDRYGFANDILVMLNGYGFRIADVPHKALYGEEKSYIKYRTFIPNLSWLLLRRFTWRLKTKYLIRGFHPLVLSYPTGISAIVLGLVIAMYAVMSTPGGLFLSVVLSITIALIGAMLLIMSMWFDVEDNRGLVLQITPSNEELLKFPIDSEDAFQIATNQAISDGGRGGGPSRRVEQVSQVRETEP